MSEVLEQDVEVIWYYRTPAFMSFVVPICMCLHAPKLREGLWTFYID